MENLPSQRAERLENLRKSRVTEHFSRSAECWDAIYGNGSEKVSPYYAYFMQQRRTLALALIADHARGRSLRILDVGCGAGPLLEKLAQDGHEVVGADLSLPMLLRARSAILRVGGKDCSNLVLADAEQLPFLADAFDVVCCLGLVEYLAEDNDILAEVRRVLRPRGLWVMSAPNLLKAKNLLDPYYYCVRGWQYLSFKLGLARGARNPADIQAGEAVGFNEDFSCRRFVRGYWPRAAGGSGFVFKKCVGIGYGPFSFCRRDVLGPSRMIRLSSTLDKLASFPGARWLDFFSNRWVYAFERIR